MCGIAGIHAYHYAANPVDRDELTRIRDDMATRGPDGAGEWYAPDDRIGLGHRRLSIIDLSDTGIQPMTSADRKLVITFNGEIFNFRALRQALEAKGKVFQSNSDTEVLLHLYADKGAEMVHDLRGMFAFAIWDAERRQLFLARDPYGIKPLYYADDGWTFRFASQVKALLAGGKVSSDPDPAGWTGYYLFGSVPEPYTTYRGIRSLEAGATLMVDRAGPRPVVKYFTVAKTYCRAEARAERLDGVEVEQRIRSALLDSVRHHLVADVPVGAFLSAGIDSGALVGLMRDAGQSDIQTVTLAFSEFHGKPTDEAPLAEQMARLYGTRHTARVVTEREFQHDLPRIMAAMDQPTIDGINTWFVSKVAHELGLKVAISGLGGDELFGSYPSFGDIPRWVRWLAAPSLVPGLGRAMRHAMVAVSPQTLGANPKVAGMLELGGTFSGAYLLKRGLFMPWELDQVMDRDMAREGLRRLCPLAAIDAALDPRPATPFARVATLESAMYMRNQLLRDTDWASMAHSLEVRVPLVDSTLLGDIAPITIANRPQTSKKVLAKSPSVALPAAVSSRPKTGFTTPVASWLQRINRQQIYANVPLLAQANCPWSRRWAYSVAAT